MKHLHIDTILDILEKDMIIMALTNYSTKERVEETFDKMREDIRERIIHNNNK